MKNIHVLTLLILVLFFSFIPSVSARVLGGINSSLLDSFDSNLASYTFSNISLPSRYDSYLDPVTNQTRWSQYDCPYTPGAGNKRCIFTGGEYEFYSHTGASTDSYVETRKEIYNFNSPNNVTIAVRGFGGSGNWGAYIYINDTVTKREIWSHTRNGGTFDTITTPRNITFFHNGTHFVAYHNYYADNSIKQRNTSTSGWVDANWTMILHFQADSADAGYLYWSVINMSTPRLIENPSNSSYIYDRGEIYGRDYIESPMNITKITLTARDSSPSGTNILWYVTSNNESWTEATLNSVTAIPDGSAGNISRWKAVYTTTDTSKTPLINWVNLTVDSDYYIFINWLSPLANHSFDTATLDFNFSVGSFHGNFSFYPVNCSLYQNGSLNQTIIGITDNSWQLFTVAYSDVVEQSFGYNITCIGRDSQIATTEKRIIYMDSVDPNIDSVFVNLSSVYYANLDGQFNFSDPFLFSFNVSIDGGTIANMSNMVSDEYSYNLSYDPTSLSVGVHELRVKVSDGHTSSLISEWEWTQDKLSKEITYVFDDGWVKILPKSARNFASQFETRKIEDRYLFNYLRHPSERIFQGTDLHFRISSSHPVSIVNRSDYPAWMVIEHLEKWIDFATTEKINGYSISRINENTVDVIVKGVSMDDIEFESIGDLNTVTKTYSFYKGNYTMTWDSFVPEGSSTIFTINFTRNTSFITNLTAVLTYNNTEYTPAKTSMEDSFYFTKSLTPWNLVDNSSLNVSVSFYWNFSVEGNSNFTNLTETNNQVVHKLLINNCSQYTSTVTLILTLLDEETSASVISTVDTVLKVWYGGFASAYMEYPFSFSGNSTYNICIYPPNAVYQVSTNILSYDADGYAERNYAFDNMTLSNVSTTLNLYLLNDSSASDITLTVYDNEGQTVSGEMIQILKFDPGTGTSKVVEAVITDDKGQSLASLILAQTYYWFILSQDNIVHLQTSPAKLTSASKFFTINLQGELYESYKKMFNVYHDLVYVNSTQTFRFTWVDTQNLVQTACLNITRENAFSETRIYDNCLSSAAGSISYSLSEDTTGKTYVATGWIETNTEYSTYYVEKLIKSFRESLQVYGKDGLVASIFIVLGCAGALAPVGGTLLVLATMIGVTVAVLLGLWQLSWLSVITLLILGGILMAKSRT